MNSESKLVLGFEESQKSNGTWILSSVSTENDTSPNKESPHTYASLLKLMVFFR